MHGIGEALPYLAAILTLVSGVAGFFWARSGERNAVGGVGWALLGLIGLSGAVAVWQIADKGARDRAAKIEADAKAAVAAEEARQAKGQAARQLALADLANSDIDRTRPVQAGSFYFDLGTEREAPRRVPGFIGPFPVLRAGESGTLAIGIPDGVDFEFALAPVSGGGLRISPATGPGPAYLLRSGGDAAQFEPLGKATGASNDNAGGAGSWGSEAIEWEFGYFLDLGLAMQMQALINRLAHTERYGRLELTLAAPDPARRKAIEQGYRTIRPMFVFLAATRHPEQEADGTCVTRIRVPLDMVPVAASAPNRLAFDIRAAPEGFQPETCGYTP
jgi:hypothetical protein